MIDKPISLADFLTNPAHAQEIDYLPLRGDTHDTLKKIGIFYIGELVICAPEFFLKIPGMDRLRIQDIKEALQEEGLSLGVNLEYFGGPRRNIRQEKPTLQQLEQLHNAIEMRKPKIATSAAGLEGLLQDADLLVSLKNELTDLFKRCEFDITAPMTGLPVPVQHEMAKALERHRNTGELKTQKPDRDQAAGCTRSPS